MRNNLRIKVRNGLIDNNPSLKAGVKGIIGKIFSNPGSYSFNRLSITPALKPGLLNNLIIWALAQNLFHWTKYIL